MVNGKQLKTTILQGNAWELVDSLENESINCIVTSPPYYALRSYDVEKVLIGGKKDCEHEWIENIIKPKGGKGINANVGANRHVEANMRDGNKENLFCQKCGAFYGDFGIEPHPQMYIDHLVLLFEKLKPKLKKDGNLFVNLGDTFGGSGGINKGKDIKDIKGVTGNKANTSNKYYANLEHENYNNYFKPKQKLLIPQRFAIAMQNASWLCRGDWIWHKIFAMPASVKDRLNEVKEYIFHFTKNKKYFFDLDSVKVKAKTAGRVENYASKSKSINCHIRNETLITNDYKNPGDVLRFKTANFSEAHFAVFNEELPAFCIKCGSAENDTVLDPFSGAGTTGIAAKKLKRNYIGFELSEKYIEMSKKRINQVQYIDENVYVVNKNEKQLTMEF